MFDSHCHLQDRRIADGTDGVIDRAGRAGVTGFLCCGVDERDWAGVARIGAAYGGVICAYGVHPWFADRAGDKWDSTLRGYLDRDRRAAVGEIGLDNAVDPRNDDRQAEIFTRQLEIAEEFCRPVSIHCRGAWGSLLSILKSRGGLSFGGAIHSYSGSPELVAELLKSGCSISFSGSILNPENRRAAESLKRVPPDRLLVETDSPDILPKSAVGPHNEPSNLPLVVNRVAAILERPPKEIARLTYDNAMRLFAPGSF